MLQWFVCRTNPRCEERASAGLAARLAGKGAIGAGERLFSKGPVEYDPPKYPQRPFKADYPGEVPADATGKLQRDIEGRPLTAQTIAGRTQALRPDRAVGEQGDLARVVEGTVGEPYRTVPRGKISDGSGATFTTQEGRPIAVAVADDLHPDDVPRVLAHETGHVISEMSGKIPIDGLQDELAQVYHSQITGERWGAKPVTPQSIGYPDAEAPQEYMAEAIRNYLLDPNSMKTVAPKTAARIREFVNANPKLKDIIQFNTVAPIAAGGAGLAAMTSDDAKGQTMPIGEIRITGPDGSTFAFPEGTGGDVITAAMQSHYGAPKPPADDDPRGGFMGKVDSVVRGAADAMTFGLSDEISAGLGAATGLGGTFGDYSGNLERQRQTDRADASQRGGYRLGGQVAGSVAGGVGLAKNGMSLAARAVDGGAGLGKASLMSAADGAIMGGLSGAGSGEGTEGRLIGAAVGAPTGAALGGMLPSVTALGTGAVKGATGWAMGRMYPEEYARRALGETFKRSGKSVDDIARALEAAQADGQGMFTAADAMGNAGQRSLAAIARTPNDARQQLTEALVQRQTGQADRLSNALAEGFGAPDTAAQRVSGLTKARADEASVLYGQAREEAGAVNVTPVLREIDRTLSPGVTKLASPRDKIAPDTIEGALLRVRSMLSDGKSNVSDFNSLFRVKLDVDDAIARAEAQGAGNRAHALAGVQRQIDAALAETSAPYATARDAFAAASRNIDAVGEGSAATSGRTRATDNIQRFDAMTPGEQSAFRGGYADPLIANVEASSAAPLTNKARPLMSEKKLQEFHAFAVPGKGEQMGGRVTREQRMFETANAVLGGSKTADNLADMADLNRFDPSIAVNLLGGNFKTAALNVLARALSEVRGTPPAVSSKLAQALMETNPDAVRSALTSAASGAKNRSAAQQQLVSALLGAGAAGAGRLTAPR